MSYPRSSSAGAVPASPPLRSGRTASLSSLGGSGSRLPPPPPSSLPPPNNSHAFSNHMAKSMTIEEMRQLHQQALREAENKRTELRLVLASRYRELVGSSDEVIRMKERAKELHDLVTALPGIMEKLSLSSASSNSPGGSRKDASEEESKDNVESRKLIVRRQLSVLPREVHRALDKKNFHQATTLLIDFFSLIASHTDEYRLATKLAASQAYAGALPREQVDGNLCYQMRLMFLQMQIIPDKIQCLCRRLLATPSYALGECMYGAAASAEALASLHRLELDDAKNDPAAHLLDLYWEAKSTVLKSLLNQLGGNGDEKSLLPRDAEAILANVVLLLQHDVILHFYEICCRRDFPMLPKEVATSAQEIMMELPQFDVYAVQAKCTQFLTFHLPLIRIKVQGILVSIAGTTASALGQMRQSLYDKTDGVECQQQLALNPVAHWEEAVATVVDPRTFPKFSLWSVLFSSTFTSLVHSLLTTSFQSVHACVIQSLRHSLAQSPPLAQMLPHEAYRNTVAMATELDQALRKVSDDAHELLVHAEEREESERRLRQSLYVQTCEIMGRILCELRRMVHRTSNDTADAANEFIVGRLCYLLKYRLTILPTLLDPKAIPPTGGMIGHIDLQSAFDLADDNDDGVITLEEAMEAVDSAFAGTSFNGAQVVRETLLLSAKEEQDEDAQSQTVQSVTLDELVLLTARGLRHEESGAKSALGVVQRALDDIVTQCFEMWAHCSLEKPGQRFCDALLTYQAESLQPLNEWKRARPSSTDQTTAESVSPHVVCYLLDASSVLSRSTGSSDSRLFSPPLSDALSTLLAGGTAETLTALMRRRLLAHSRELLCGAFAKAFPPDYAYDKHNVDSLAQLYIDATFLSHCFFERRETRSNNSGDDCATSADGGHVEAIAAKALAIIHQTEPALARKLPSLSFERRRAALAVSDLFSSALFGADTCPDVSAEGEVELGAIGSKVARVFPSPLASSRRFAFLPVQADRSISELQAREKYAKQKVETESREDISSSNVMSKGFGSVMSSGFGFFSKK